MLLALLAGCGKKADEDQRPRIDFGPNGGVTETDANNRPTGHVDATDWSLDGEWNEQELALFSSLNVPLNAAASSTFNRQALRTLYPNPAGQLATFPFEKPPGMALEIVVADQHYQVISRTSLGSTTGGYGLQLVLNADQYANGQTYRLYYVFYAGSTLQAKGHGDIKISR
ncbi:hypothetical protein DLM85_11490 [Hymenobacter edaphi]|uniref:Uncharacterized protein n=1 Tax=Hymenobacter edaphi TaxID=2211146 RepID=A0A328BLH6_9BACT|nr:hypothetical protein DLM85_11490 [Hymenobacter edaphi]